MIAPRRRRGGGALAMAIDLLAASRRGRTWLVLLVVLSVVIASAVGTTVHYTVPWLVYGGL